MQDSLTVAMQTAMTNSLSDMLNGFLKLLFIIVILPTGIGQLLHIYNRRKAASQNNVSWPEFNKSIQRAHAEREKGDKELHSRVDESNRAITKILGDVQFIRGHISKAIENGNKNA